MKTVTGFAPPGQATFIIGSSGAGKTTLLNIICDRVVLKASDKLSGNVLINDSIPCDKKVFAAFGAYVQQDDALFSHFTVREAMTFSARLKLKIPDDEQDRLVEKIIFNLGLTMVANSQIGSVQRKVISGGERKRTSIGVEMVSDPSILMLDDPTAGLDSFKAYGIVLMLNKMART